MFLFAKEIEEQPQALQKLVDNIPSVERELSKIHLHALSSPRIAFFGMGSSLYSAFASVYLLRSAGISADYYDASEALWHFSQEWFRNVDICVFVSQSGETVEIRNLVDKVKRTNVLKMGVTANVNSYLGMNSDIVLDISSGRELSLGSTKTHMNSVVTNIVFSLFITKRLKMERKNIQSLPVLLEEIVSKAREEVNEFSYFEIADKIEGSVITSRGFALGEVYQSALTLNEIARVSVFAISAGMLRHGPLELFAEKRGIICFIPKSPSAKLLIKLCRDISHISSFAWIISDEEVKNDVPNESSIHVTSLNTGLAEYLQNLIFLPYIQFLSCKIREMKKIPDDDFRLISKVTTKE